MAEYFMYLGEMVKAVLRNLGRFFATLFARPWIGSDGPLKGIGSDFAEYNTYFQTYKGNFGFMGWFFFVLFALLFLAVIFGIGYVLYRLIRKYVRFTKKEIEKIQFTLARRCAKISVNILQKRGNENEGKEDKEEKE